jgi:hypothetical protein
VPSRWKAEIPSLGRLKLYANYNKSTKFLKIIEMRLIPIEVEFQAWKNDEPALAVMSSWSAGVFPNTFTEKKELVAGIGLHSIARLLQRGTERSKASLVAAFIGLMRGAPDAINAGGAFAIPAASGKWHGEIVTDDSTPYALVRTYIGD